MALLEILQRKARRLGLIPKLVRSLPKLSILLWLAGILWLVMLPMDGQYRHTYMSENALMPSQAYSFFRESEWNYLRGYRDEVYLHKMDPLEERNAMVEKWLDVIGFDTAVLNYTTPEGVSQPILYGILHASKGDDTEAMVLVAPWKDRSRFHNLGGVALGVSLAKYFHRLSIWAKNIIVVFPEDGQDTLRYWVDAYHTTMDQTGGSILSAIIMEYASGSDGLDYVAIEYPGLNGQLPNLDLFNTAAMISEHEGLKVSIHGTPKGQLWSNDYWGRLTTMVHAVWDYATAGLLPPPSRGGGDGCEAFSGWNIQTVTLTAMSEGRSDITTYGRVIEAVFRSVNNLLEKFHQSYFFYLLLGPEQFVSIATYLPSAVLCAAAFALASASALLGNNNVKNDRNRFDPSVIYASTAGAPVAALLCFFAVLSLSVTFGLRLMNLSQTSLYDQENPRNYMILTYGLIVPATLLTAWPLLASVLVNMPTSKAVNDSVRYLNAFSLFYFAFALIACLVLHFSLSMMISLAALPMIWVKYGPVSDKKTRLKSAAWLLASSPFTWMFILGVFQRTNFTLDRARNFFQYFSMNLLRREIQNIIDFCEETSIVTILQGPTDVLYALLSGYPRFQSWTWLFLIISWIPAWLCTVIVSAMDVETADVEIAEGKKEN